MNQNKALAYLKWRSNTQRRILYGPSHPSSNAIGLLAYCHQRAVKNEQFKFKENRIKSIHTRNINKQAFGQLKQNRLRMAIKQKAQDKAYLHNRERVLVKCMRVLKQFLRNQKNKQQQAHNIHSYHGSILMMKAIENLKHYTFKLRRLKKIKNYRGLKHWSKMTKVKVMAVLHAYAAKRKEKKRLQK